MYKGTYRSPVSVILLSIVTCGIYYIYWIYKSAQELQFFLQAQDMNPGMDCLLSVVCFPYSYYWWYKYGKGMDEARSRVGLMPDNNSVLYLIMAIFGLHVVNAAIMQSSLNKLWEQA